MFFSSAKIAKIIDICYLCDKILMTMATSFLDAVAQAYVGRHNDLSRFCFVFPNKRAGTFFLKSLAGTLGERTMLAPEVLAVNDFVMRISGREIDSRIDMLFRLYDVYCSLKGRGADFSTDEGTLDFDRFAPWGETVLNDFSEVDQYDVDAEALFKNVKDFREIASNFLSDEQREVIEHYFGYTPSLHDVEGFWRNLDIEEHPSDIKDRFVELWQVLPELYRGLRDNLEAAGLCMPGSAFRIAAERVAGRGVDWLPWGRVVFVGFNALSTTECALFEELRGYRCEDGDDYAEFFWDGTGPVLEQSHGKASRDLRRNRRNFPSPGWAAPVMALSERDRMPASITVSSSPSNAAQAKIAGMKVDELLTRIDSGKVSDARVAVVLPDENMLMPILYSLPDSLEAVNLTMGYPIRHTPVASFMYHLKRLVIRARRKEGTLHYLQEDLRALLAHPLAHLVAGSAAVNDINGYMAHHHRFMITSAELARFSPVMADMLTPPPGDCPPETAMAYIDSVLLRMDEALAGSAGHTILKSKLERSHILVYRKALARVLAAVREHGVSMRMQSVFHLVDRLLAGEKANFEGEPLQGLQVMGLLETRAIDFDHVIMLSLNDKVMPRRARRRTFVPDSLRHGFGLPVSSSAESLYSYYFYRLLSRAKEVTLIYDAREGEGMRSGGKSRFLLQLDLLYAKGMVRHENYSFALNSADSAPEPVVKTPEVMERLEKFKVSGSGYNLSASSLSVYCGCPVQFYYKTVEGINDDPEPSDTIDSITQGNIVHDMMLHLYFPEELRKKYLKDRLVITPDRIRAILSDREDMERMMLRMVNRHHFHREEEDLYQPLPQGIGMIAARLLEEVREILRHDLRRAPLVLLGGELSGTVKWQAGNSPAVNMRYAFDRVEEIDDGRRLKVIDYKTGSVKVDAVPTPVFDSEGNEIGEDPLGSVFAGDYRSKNVFQLLLYANLINIRAGIEEGVRPRPVNCVIYDGNNIAAEGETLPEIRIREEGKSKYNKLPLTDHLMVNDSFLENLERVINEIFDPTVPFHPASDPDTCTRCRFMSLCCR